MILFIKKAREVSSKYHKIGRSIIKKRQTSYKTSEISNEMHQLCPRTWLLVPTYMGSHDHVHGYE